MKLDTTLRSLTGPCSPALISMISGASIVERLPTEFPDTRDRRVDTLLRLDDGTIQHIEWQSSFDAAMPRRMLEYWLLITSAHPNAALRQAVIQVGGKRQIAGTLEATNLSYRYQVIDSRTLDPAPLLESPETVDNILAIMFGSTSDLPATIRAILLRIAPLDLRARTDAMSQMRILAEARDATDLIQKEIMNMPLQIDLSRDTPVARWLRGELEQANTQGRAEGKAEGEAKALMLVIERRFGPLPASLRERISSADIATVESWLVRSTDTPSLDALFSDPPVN